MNRDEIMALDAAQLRLAIAEAKGYELVDEFSDGSKIFTGPVNEEGLREGYYIISPHPLNIALPDWPNDIAIAIHLLAEMPGSVTLFRHMNSPDSWSIHAYPGLMEMPISVFNVPLAEGICRVRLLWKASA